MMKSFVLPTSDDELRPGRHDANRCPFRRRRRCRRGHSRGGNAGRGGERRQVRNQVAAIARVGHAETNRAVILVTDPEGLEPFHMFATGLRNGVGIAVNPETGDLWSSTNERDGLGDNLVPDYITRVKPGGYYGWPWYYLGNHEDPRHAGERPDLAGQAIVPDVLLQAHSASLEMCF